VSFFLSIVRLGLVGLMLHRLRSVLTSLGIILGVAAVIVMVAIAEGTKQSTLRQIQALGATNVIVRSVRPPESSTVTSQQRSMVVSFGILRTDLARIEHFVRDAVSVVPIKSVGDEMNYREKRLTSQAFGVTPALTEVTSLRVSRGRYLTEEDMRERSNVAVLGDHVSQQFFPLEDPIGKDIRIGSRIFRVVGVLAPVGLAGGKGTALVGRDLNEDVHIPLSTAELEFGDTVMRRSAGSFSGEDVQVSEIFITAPSTESVLDLAQRVRRLMEIDHPDLRDIQIIVPWELLENAKRTQMVWNIVLVAIAAISLLVGGIGIMNIMLASVTERTREIGIRRALGATRRHITIQFLVETGTLACLGGLIGIMLGVGTSVAIGVWLPKLLASDFMRKWFDTKVEMETQVTLWSIITSFLVAASVGILFGIYPAIVASRKDPIVALRHD